MEEAKEKRKNRPSDEKKKEQEEKLKQDALYRYCLIDNETEKISNFVIEPPGIFRGRGEHPLAGKFKYRIVPEFVSINVGLNDAIPICTIPGHNWKKVVSLPESTWLCHYRDERNPKSNGKYV